MVRRARARRTGSPADTYIDLRARALAVTQETIGCGSSAYPDLYGVVVDIPSSGGVASVVALADGTTSMYTSFGGGTIGAGAHEAVVRATHVLLAEIAERIEMFPLDERVDLPGEDLVRITVMTRAGRRRANVPEAAFWGREPSTVGDLISAIQGVISAIREVSPA